MVMRETSKEMAGDCNGPLGLVLERRKIINIIILINLFLWLFAHVLVVCYVTYVRSDPWVLILIVIGIPWQLWGATASPSETLYTKLWCKSASNLAFLYKHVHSIMIWNHHFGQSLGIKIWNILCKYEVLSVGFSVFRSLTHLFLLD